MATRNEIIKFFDENDPKIAAILREMKIEPIKPAENLFLDMVESIVGQQLSGKAASTLVGRFYDLFGDKAKATAERIVALPIESIRGAGISGAKTRAITELAAKVAAKELDLEALRTATDETIYNTLLSLRGVGPWTAEMFLMFSLAREDIFSVGDLGLRNAVKKLYFKGADVELDKIEKQSRQWQPYRTYASLALWHSLDNR